jgi:hypothetical protein
MAIFAAACLLVVAPACSKKKDKASNVRKVKAQKDGGSDDDGSDGSGSGPKTNNQTMSAAVPDGIEFGVARTALARPKMGDRFYVASVLTQVFGPDSAPVVNPLVRDNMAAFGGPCDQAGRVGGNNCGGRLSFSQLPMLPVSMATREGYRLRACETLTFDDNLLKYAVGQIEAATLLDPPNSTAVDKVYEQFYPGQKPTTAVHDALVDVVRKASDGKTPLDGWRFLFMTVCSSPDWQLL